ncbi:MAG: helix-turn-helix domain-containing protein [Sphingomonadaceae bacterium]
MTVKFAGFSSRLVEAAELAGFNSARLASAVGVARGTMARYWNGERMFPADLLFRVADIIGVSPRWLVTGDGSAEPPIESGGVDADEECRLLIAFRRLTIEQQEHVTQSAQLLASSPTLHSPRTRYKAQPR